MSEGVCYFVGKTWCFPGKGVCISVIGCMYIYIWIYIYIYINADDDDGDDDGDISGHFLF